MIRNKSTWFAVEMAQNVSILEKDSGHNADNVSQQSKHLSCLTVDFHTEILKAVLEGFVVPTSILGALEAIVGVAKDSVIKFSAEGKSETSQFWIMMTTYEYLEEMDKVEPSIRLINFRSTKKMNEYALGKSSVSRIEFDLEFSQTKVLFNDKIYAPVFQGVQDDLIARGKTLTKDTSFDLAVPE